MNIDKKILVKYAKLYDVIKTLLPDGILVAFSGGVDSVFLLWAANQVKEAEGGRLQAFTAQSDSLPQRDRADAIAFLQKINVSHEWVTGTELENADYVSNSKERCYFCKHTLFAIGATLQEKNNLKWMLDGYNASDQNDTRPGHRAAQQFSVRSLLFEIGLLKSEIRDLMQAFNVPYFDKADSPCLSSRITTGIKITPKRLKDVDVLEEMIRENGCPVVRVRIQGNTDQPFIRVEVPDSHMNKVLNIKDSLKIEAKNRGYRWVTLDLAGYKMGGGVV